MSTPSAGSPPASTPANKRRISSNNATGGASTPTGGPSTKKSKVSGSGQPALSRKSSAAGGGGKSNHPLRQTSFPPESGDGAGRRRRSVSVTSNATTSFTRGNSVDRVLVPPPAGSNTATAGKDDAGGKEDDGEGSDDEVDGDLLTTMRIGDMEESREQKEEEQRRLNILMDHFDDDQMARYEAYRRGTLQKSAVKKVANLVLGQSISPNVASAIGGFTKIFAGELVERAREIQMAWGDDEPGSPLLPEHIREAARRWRLENGKSAGDHVTSLENGQRRTVVGGMGGRLFK